MTELKTKKQYEKKWSVVSNNKLLCSVGKQYIFYKSGVLYIQTGIEGNQNKLIELPISKSKKYVIKNRLLERVLRLEPRMALSLNEYVFLLSYQGRIYNINVTTKDIYVEHNYRPGMNNALSFCRVNDRILYGEYFGNGNHESVCVYERLSDGTWVKRYKFKAGEIKHIHQIVFDKYRSCFWILTGDTDNESGIWRADMEFESVIPIFRGKQMYRSCFIVPCEMGVTYATDTPLETNAIYYTEPDEQGNWKEPIKIYEMPGPCIYGKMLDDGRYALATSVEPDSSLPRLRYRLSRRLGAGVKDRYSHVVIGNSENIFNDILTVKKDIYKMWLFQFGNILFPDTSTKEGLLCTGQSLKGIDEKTVLIEI